MHVILWGRKAGTLVETKKGYASQICFYFDPDFVRSGYDISPLHASIHSKAALNGFPVYPESDRLFGGLPSMIADSLPDHWGNTVFREWARQKGIRIKDLTALDKLAFIGRRGMGALEFIPPASIQLEEPFKVEIADLSELADKAMDEAKGFHADLKTDFMVESLFKVGTSAGGRRPKAVINVNLPTGECYSGQVASPLPGFTPMIIKFEEKGDIPTTRIEYSFYLMARSIGLHMMPSCLIETGGRCHFLTERFDRNGDEKIHIQTLAAMNPVSDCYEDLFDAASRLSLLPEETTGLFMQMVLNAACGNIDDHNKNFSFMMASDGIWHAAPAYDFTFAVDPDAPNYVNVHSMTINGKNRNIEREDLTEIAGRFNIKEANAIINKILSAASGYRSFAEEAAVPKRWIGIIEEEIQDRISLL